MCTCDSVWLGLYVPKHLPSQSVSPFCFLWSSTFKRFFECHRRPLLLALVSPSRYQGILDVFSWLCVSCLLPASRYTSTSAGLGQNRQVCSLLQTFFHTASCLFFAREPAWRNSAEAHATRCRLCTCSFASLSNKSPGQVPSCELASGWPYISL